MDEEFTKSGIAPRRAIKIKTILNAGAFPDATYFLGAALPGTPGKARPLAGLPPACAAAAFGLVATSCVVVEGGP